MGLPTSANKTDVLRHPWMRWSVIIMHRLGLIKELIASGFMTTDVEELPLGHPSANITIIIVYTYALATRESVVKCRYLSERTAIWRLYCAIYCTVYSYIVLSICILCTVTVIVSS